MVKFPLVEFAQPGNYQLNFKFRDVIGGQEIDCGQSIVVTKN